MDNAFPQKNKLVIRINPMGKPRMTNRDKWAKRPVVVRYWAWKDELLLKAPGFFLPDNFSVEFRIQMPKSWSEKKKKRMFLQPHKVKPDLDNCIKSLLDSLTVETNDSYIWKITASKVWDREGSIIISWLE